MYGRTRGGRVWHLISIATCVSQCRWRAIVETRSLPGGRLCKECYAIREEQYAPYQIVGGERTYRHNV